MPTSPSLSGRSGKEFAYDAMPRRYERRDRERECGWVEPVQMGKSVTSRSRKGVPSVRWVWVAGAFVALISLSILLLFLFPATSGYPPPESQLVRIDLRNLHTAIFVYAEGHENSIPALDTTKSPEWFSSVVNEWPEGKSDLIDGVLKRKWQYYIPSALVGRRINDIDPEEVLVRVRGGPTGLKWVLKVNGRVGSEQ